MTNLIKLVPENNSKYEKIILTALILFTCNSFLFSQKIAYIDSEYILSNIPEFISSQEEINELSKNGKKIFNLNIWKLKECTKLIV